MLLFDKELNSLKKTPNRENINCKISCNLSIINIDYKRIMENIMDNHFEIVKEIDIADYIIKLHDKSLYMAKVKCNANEHHLRKLKATMALHREIKTLQTIKKVYPPYKISSNRYSLSLYHYVKGKSLSSVLHEYNNVNKYLHCVSKGLMYLHNNGFIHRNICADNIIVKGNGRCVIVDYDECVYIGEHSPYIDKESVTHVDTIAPESYKMGLYNRSSDVWSMGAVCYMIILKKRPYKITEHNCLRIDAYNDIYFNSIPNVYREIVKSCMVLDYTKRITVHKLFKLVNGGN